MRVQHYQHQEWIHARLVDTPTIRISTVNKTKVEIRSVDATITYRVGYLGVFKVDVDVAIGSARNFFELPKFL
jgi:hypothetical protein